MRLLKALQGFEFTVSGGFAFYILSCVISVTLIGFYVASKDLIYWFNKL